MEKLNKHFISLDLQFFGEEPEDEEVETDEGNDDETVADEEDEEGEEGNDDADDVGDDERDEEEGDEEKQVSLKALKAEREKWKKRLNDPSLQKALNLAEKIKKATGKDLDAIEKDLEAIELQRRASAYEQQGLSKEQAFYYAQQEHQNQSLQRQVRDIQRDSELVELAKDSFYADAKAYRNELYDMVEKAQLAGLPMNLKQAYNALRGEARLKEMQTDMEQRNLAKRRQVESKKVENDGTTSTKDSFSKKLSKNDKAAAEELGWSYEKYYKVMYQDQA